MKVTDLAAHQPMAPEGAPAESYLDIEKIIAVANMPTRAATPLVNMNRPRRRFETTGQPLPVWLPGLALTLLGGLGVLAGLAAGLDAVGRVEPADALGNDAGFIGAAAHAARCAGLTSPLSRSRASRPPTST